MMNFGRCIALVAAIFGLIASTATVAGQGVIINEFVAVNEAGLTDSDGDRSDWVELYNQSAAPVSLLGWSLTDDSAQLRKWQFPATNIAAGGYLVIFASGKDRTNVAAELHTNFQLDGDGEFLALVTPEGAIASQFSPKFPRQRKNMPTGLGQTACIIISNRQHPAPQIQPTTSNSSRTPSLVSIVAFSARRSASS